ncbi:MAG: major capsid protein, partial [Candidatus Methanomethylicaceae archaeon]
SGTGSGFQDILGTASSGNASVTLARNPSSGSLTSSQLSINADEITTDAYADLSSATPISINELREAFALQRYQEARARYGSRYVEYLRYLGVRGSDARLQRPEYLGGGRQTIQFSEVLQTAEGTSTPVGEMRGHGITAVRSNRYRRYFEEHGFVFTMISVLPKTIYAQGLQRHWSRWTKEDYWQKELQHIGQQQVLNKEVYAASANPDGGFGYQDRYDEYRRSESTIAGEFRTSALYDWHFARIFGAEPELDDEFVTANPTKRVFASQNTDVLYLMVNHSIQARRMVARKGNSFIY